MKLTPKTYVVFPTTEKAKAKFYKANLLKTADLLESLPNSRHSQKDFGLAPSEHSCATVGCALGLAAMYNIIPGLQYRIGEESFFAEGYFIEPVVNGKKRHWEDTAELFFSWDACDIFWDTTTTKKKTIAALRRLANQMGSAP